VVAVDIFTSRTARKTQQATRKGKKGKEKKDRMEHHLKEKQKEKFEFADLVCDAISNHRKSERKREGGKKVAFIFSRGVRAEKGREHRRQQNSKSQRSDSWVGWGGNER